jgi:hypothetical protein
MRMRKPTLLYLLIATVTSGLLLSPTTLAQQAGNEVLVYFLSSITHEVRGDTFTNKEVSGSTSWHTRIINTPDETGGPITDLKVTLNSELQFDLVPAQHFTRMGPPVYEWSFGSAPEAGSEYLPWLPDACIGFSSAEQSPCTFTPGFDVLRSADKTIFSGPDTQTVTITITPREKVDQLENLGVCVHAMPNPDEEHFIDAHITSVSTSYGEHVELSPDGYDLDIRNIPLETNLPWQLTFNLEVSPEVPKIEYMPYFAINWGDPHAEPYASGTTSGASVSFTNDAGSWTVSDKGNYVWSWEAHPPGYSISFHPRENRAPELTSGRVSSPFVATLIPYTFEVIYTDADDRSPSEVRLYIDDSPIIMGYGGRHYDDGAIYRCKARLSTGVHNYYFEAEDGAITVRFPEEGALSLESRGFPVWGIPVIVAIVLGIFFFVRRRRKRRMA